MKKTQVKSQKELQILKKLKTVKKEDQLRKIQFDLQQQSKSLVNQVRQLNEKVVTLLEKQKMKASSEPSNSEAASELKTIKTQLSMKYKEMRILKSKLSLQKPTVDEDVLNSQAARKNNFKKTLNQLEQYQTIVTDLKAQNKKLEESVGIQQKQMSQVDPSVLELERQNSDMRKRLSQLRRSSQSKLYESVKVQDNLAKVQNHYRFNAKVSMVELKTIDTPNKADLLKKQELLKRQIESLKNEVGSIQTVALRKTTQEKKQKQKRVQQNKKVLARLKIIQNQKIKGQLQLNKYKIMWKKICQRRQSKKRELTFVEASNQISQFQDKDPLRRDFGGVIGKNKFDDRLILKEDKKCFIKGLVTYENDRGFLTAIRCLYSNSLETDIAIPLPYLNRCKATKVQLSEDDFIKVIKLKYNSLDNRILKVEMISNKNSKFEIGQKRPFSDSTQNQVVYGFDIAVKEYPVCCFGSFTLQKGQWYLQSFGSEISEF